MWVIHLFKGDGSIGSFGHVSLEMPNTDTYISFYPTGKGSTGQSSGSSSSSSGFSADFNMGSIVGCPGSFYESYSKEELYYKKEAKHWLIYGLNSEKMVEWWKDFRENPILYHITDNNCAVVVYNALCKGNEWFKDDQHAKTPEKVFELVKAYSKKQAEQKRCEGICCCPVRFIGSSVGSIGSSANVICGKRCEKRTVIVV